jgi:hypothetical protein
MGITMDADQPAKDEQTEEDEGTPITDWDKLDALEEPKKPRRRSWVDDPNIGGSGPQVAG